MADLSFRPDPELPASPKPEKPPAPAWVGGCKSGLLTVLTFFFLLAMVFATCAGFAATNHHIGELGKKIDALQKDVNDLKTQKPEEKKAMPPAN